MFITCMCPPPSTTPSPPHMQYNMAQQILSVFKCVYLKHKLKVLWLFLRSPSCYRKLREACGQNSRYLFVRIRTHGAELWLLHGCIKISDRKPVRTIDWTLPDKQIKILNKIKQRDRETERRRHSLFFASVHTKAEQLNKTCLSVCLSGCLAVALYLCLPVLSVVPLKTCKGIIPANVLKGTI